MVECLLDQVLATSNLRTTWKWEREMDRMRRTRSLKVFAYVDRRCECICAVHFVVRMQAWRSFLCSVSLLAWWLLSVASTKGVLRLSLVQPRNSSGGDGRRSKRKVLMSQLHTCGSSVGSAVQVRAGIVFVTLDWLKGAPSS